MAEQLIIAFKAYAEKSMMLDAPMSGGVPAAEAGKLTFMVGGLQEAYLAAKPLLSQWEKRQYITMGLEMVQLQRSVTTWQWLSEAFTLGQHLGIKHSVLTDIQLLKCPLLEQAKDLGLAMASASGVSFKCLIGSQAPEIYRKLCDDDCELKDYSCAFRHYYAGKDEN
ncbi:hypothetical protein GUJ93_ZPchr0007g3749 [Zizania palustris]|uniref:6-phosphogluconate dehydrogenase NADP-binding domain-containing protein n=1 Tax=Zizania palustris TaxID=103762 RepID=A0A8J5STQ5_ZIZPA|nr:hypothetical protein GUJ93_ZPchr0007g3749 [Zizania palustris]